MAFGTRRDTNIWPVVKVTTAPDQLPVSIDEARQYCDYEDNDRNNQFDYWIRTATEAVEHDCERALITQTVKAYLPFFPDVIRLPRPPVTAIAGVTYVDVNGVTQTLATSVYQSDLVSTPPTIQLAYGQWWETTRDDTVNAVIVTFTAGYGGPEQVPALAKEAIRVRVKRAFDGCGGDAMEDMIYLGLISKLRWRLA
jgi:uncharacterized phiE125 gp8 family phage protein